MSRKSKKAKTRKTKDELSKIERQKTAEKFRRENVKHKTEAEKMVEESLNGLGISFSFQKIVMIEDHFYIVDFLIGNTVLEVDGGYHSIEEQKAYDTKRTQELMKKKYRVVRLKNEDCLNRQYLNEILSRLFIYTRIEYERPRIGVLSGLFKHKHR